jgi:Na+/H+ antiporter NhaC
MVPLLAYLKVDLGPMRDAEIAAQNQLARYPDDKTAQADVNEAFTHPNAKPVLVWAPLCVLAIVLCLLLVPLGFPTQQVSGSAFRAGLSTAYFSAAALLIVLMASLKVRSVLQSIDVYLKGMAGMTLVAVTLLLAWALSDLGRDLGAAAYISSVAQAALPAWLLPTIVFLLSATISFATGSSWGTFAIMFPLVIPTAVTIGAPLYVCMGAVLSGGLFGDHSSPISETTILSSTGAGCPQIEHFRTQLPYALINGTISLIAFTLAGLIELNLVVFAALALQIALLFALSKNQGSDSW